MRTGIDTFPERLIDGLVHIYSLNAGLSISTGIDAGNRYGQPRHFHFLLVFLLVFHGSSISMSTYWRVQYNMIQHDTTIDTSKPLNAPLQVVFYWKTILFGVKVFWFLLENWRHQSMEYNMHEATITVEAWCRTKQKPNRKKFQYSAI